MSGLISCKDTWYAKSVAFEFIYNRIMPWKIYFEVNNYIGKYFNLEAFDCSNVYKYTNNTCKNESNNHSAWYRLNLCDSSSNCTCFFNLYEAIMSKNSWILNDKKLNFAELIVLTGIIALTLRQIKAYKPI